MAYDKDPRQYDLTILYMEDAREWCEYIFDLFTPYDVFQNSEDISVFPTGEKTLEAISSSLVKIVIISPGFVEKCSPKLEALIAESAKQVIGLLCGVGQSELAGIAPRLPSYRDWTLADAQEEMRIVTQSAMKILNKAWERIEAEHMGHGTGEAEVEEDIDGNYAPMGGMGVDESQGGLYADMEGVKGQAESEDLYTFADPKVDDYNVQDTYDPLTVAPARIKCNSKKKFYIISPSSLFEVTSTCIVKIDGSTGSEHLEACVLNPYVLTVSPPKAIPSGSVTMTITCEGSKVGNASATVVSEMDELAENLKGCLEPLGFMCQSLGVAPADSNRLDNLLYEHIRSIETTNAMKEALTTSQQGLQDKEKSDKLYPTALHFAAHFGLKNITNYLLSLPGASNACKLRNRENRTPSEIAKMSGHSTLSDIMQYLPEPEKKTTGYYVRMKPGTVGYDKPKDVTVLHRTIDEGQSIYDMIYSSSDHSFIRDESGDEEPSKKAEFVKPPPPHVAAGPHLPSRLVHTTSPPPTSKRPPPPSPSSQEAMSDSQKQLWDLDRMIKNKEISQQEAHKRFTQWTALNMVPAAPAPKPLAKPDPWYKKKPTQVFGAESVREQRTQSTISRPILASSRSVPQAASAPFLRAGSAGSLGRRMKARSEPVVSFMPPPFIGSDIAPEPLPKTPLQSASSVVIPLASPRPPSTAQPVRQTNRRSRVFVDRDIPPSRDPPPIPPHSPPDDDLDDGFPNRPPPPPPQAQGTGPVVAPRPNRGGDHSKRPVPVPRYT